MVPPPAAVADDAVGHVGGIEQVLQARGSAVRGKALPRGHCGPQLVVRLRVLAGTKGKGAGAAEGEARA